MQEGLSSVAHRCKINLEKGCPVASTYGIYIGLRVSGKNGVVEECNRYDYYINLGRNKK